MITKAARKTRSRKSQVWISDYTFSLLLFILAAIISVKIIVNSFAMNTDFIQLKDDATKISEMLLSEGYPVDWNNETVIRPGLLTGKRLDPDKVAKAINLSYSALKPKLQTRYDFIVIFEEPGGDMIEFGNNCTIGSPDVPVNQSGTPPAVDCHNLLFDTVKHDNLVKLSRLIIYDSRIIRMVVYTWSS